MDRKTNSGIELHSGGSGSIDTVHRNNSGTRNFNHNKLHKRNRGRVRHKFNLGVYAVASLLAFGSVARAADTPTANQTAVASPTAVSSGSAVNQAVQVVNSQYFQQSYGGGVSCQGSTLVVAPFVIQGLQAPQFETNSDWGLTVQVSVPLDRKAVDQCKERAAIATERQRAETDKAQLDYQLVRALKCTELIQTGAFLHPSSPYAGLCADVIAMGSDGILRNGVGTVVGGVSTQGTPRPSSEEVSSQSSSPEASTAS